MYVRILLSATVHVHVYMHIIVYTCTCIYLYTLYMYMCLYQLCVCYYTIIKFLLSPNIDYRVLCWYSWSVCYFIGFLNWPIISFRLKHLLKLFFLIIMNIHTVYMYSMYMYMYNKSILFIIINYVHVQYVVFHVCLCCLSGKCVTCMYTVHVLV